MRRCVACGVRTDVDAKGYAELRAQTIKWPHDDCPELTREMYACRAGRHTGDTVISLALALEAARLERERAPGTWSVLRV